MDENSFIALFGRVFLGAYKVCVRGRGLTQWVVVPIYVIHDHIDHSDTKV